MVSSVLSAAPIGFEGQIIEVETDTSNGLPGFQIVGMGNKAIDEAKERVRRAISNSNLDFPKNKIIVNLAPAELPKDGTYFDLPIAISILEATGQIRPEETKDCLFAGELALNGDIRPIKGIINIIEAAKQKRVKTVFIPAHNINQANLIKNIQLIPVKNLKQLFLHLKKIEIIQNIGGSQNKVAIKNRINNFYIDDIYGQEQAKRAITIATAGRHNILLNGSPGTGKTMLAKTILNLLPELNDQEKITVTKLHNLSGESKERIIENRPFRSPHHTASKIAIIGGGKNPKPGEISLAHLGVLFLDELPEYPRSTIEALRQPIEDKEVWINRVNGKTCFPADFMLVATMNPCPCGYYGDPKHNCSCSTTQILNYQKKISGPMLDRFDLIINVGRTPHKHLLQKNKDNSEHQRLKKEIEMAQKLQHERFQSVIFYNSNLTSRQISQKVKLTTNVKNILNQAADKLDLSSRSYFKLIKVARTIADLEQKPEIEEKHLAEAL